MIQAVIFDCFGVLAGSESPNELLLAYVLDLRSRGLKTAILSNTNLVTLEHIFTSDQLALFDQLVVSAEVHLVKPDPQIYEITAERLGFEPANCVFTDDSAHNVQAAEAVGMKGITYSDMIHFKAELEPLLVAHSS